jgi:hypothetical protein
VLSLVVETEWHSAHASAVGHCVPLGMGGSCTPPPLCARLRLHSHSPVHVHCFVITLPGVEGVPDGGVRVTFEDKPLLSDIVFLRAWVAVDIPRLYNTMTNLLAPPVRPSNAAAITRKGSAKAAAEAAAAAEEEQQPTQQQLLQQQQQHKQVAAAAAKGAEFIPAVQFSGARAGYVFKKGPQGVGYYHDTGLCSNVLASSSAAAAAETAAAAAAAAVAAAAPVGTTGDPGSGGWIGMRTVAELRRAAGVGAPRETDSLYRPIERAPRVFNPLKVPAKLQAALPFKTKPKLVSFSCPRHPIGPRPPPPPPRCVRAPAGQACCGGPPKHHSHGGHTADWLHCCWPFKPLKITLKAKR